MITKRDKEVIRCMFKEWARNDMPLGMAYFTAISTLNKVGLKAEATWMEKNLAALERDGKLPADMLQTLDKL